MLSILEVIHSKSSKDSPFLAASGICKLSAHVSQNNDLLDVIWSGSVIGSSNLRPEPSFIISLHTDGILQLDFHYRPDVTVESGEQVSDCMSVQVY
jgi:hypothetical protein